MEMNTRLQVEHPVTEMVTGWTWSSGRSASRPASQLPSAQDDIALRGHAIEARVYAEDPARGLPAHRRPGAGVSRTVRRPVSGSIPACRPGMTSAATTTRCWPRSSRTAPTAPRRCARWTARWPTPPCWVSAPTSTSCGSCWPTTTWLRAAWTPDCSSGWLFAARTSDDEALIAAAAYRWLQRWAEAPGDLWDVPSGWRLGEPAPTSVRLRCGDRTDHVHITGSPRAALSPGRGRRNPLHLAAALTGGMLSVTVDGVRRVPHRRDAGPSDLAGR